LLLHTRHSPSPLTLSFPPLSPLFLDAHLPLAPPGPEKGESAQLKKALGPEWDDEEEVPPLL